MPQRYYTQLSQEEREQIEKMLGLGLYQTEIAEALGRDKSTISREIRRNGMGNKNHRNRVNKPGWALLHNSNITVP